MKIAQIRSTKTPRGANHKLKNLFTHIFYDPSLFTMSSGLGYTDLELQALLDIIEEVLPQSPNECKAVLHRHIENLDELLHQT